MKRCKRVYDKLCTLECKTHRSKAQRRNDFKNRGIVTSMSLSSLSSMMSQGCILDESHRRKRPVPLHEDSDSTETSHEDDSDATESYHDEDWDTADDADVVFNWGPKEFSRKFRPLGVSHASCDELINLQKARECRKPLPESFLSQEQCVTEAFN